jgi:hypothetical protein
MSRRSKLRGDLLDRAIEMREVEGRSYRYIAGKLGVTTSMLSWAFLKEGVDGPRSSVLMPAGPPVYMRAGREVRRFTPEEDAELLRLARAGLSSWKIGRQLVPPRPGNSVLGRLYTLARIDARAEAAVHGMRSP